MTDAAAGQRQLAEQLPVPLAIIVGDADWAVQVAFFEPSMTGGHPNGRQVLIAGAGHAPQRSHSVLFNDVLLAFLNDCLPQVRS